jgi:hypothetical protein
VSGFAMVAWLDDPTGATVTEEGRFFAETLSH